MPHNQTGGTAGSTAMGHTRQTVWGQEWHFGDAVSCATCHPSCDHTPTFCPKCGKALTTAPYASPYVQPYTDPYQSPNISSDYV